MLYIMKYIRNSWREWSSRRDKTAPLEIPNSRTVKWKKWNSYLTNLMCSCPTSHLNTRFQLIICYTPFPVHLTRSHTIQFSAIHSQSAGGWGEKNTKDTRPKRIRLTFSVLHIWRHNFYHFIWIYLCTNVKKVGSLLNWIKKYMYVDTYMRATHGINIVTIVWYINVLVARKALS